MTSRRFFVTDQSLSSCGFALWDEGDDLVVSGAWPLAESVKKRSGGFVDLFRYMVAFHKEKPITNIAHETPIKMGIDGVDKLIGLYGLVAVMETFAMARKIPIQSIAIQTWRTTYFSKEERAGAKDYKRLAVLRSRQLGFDPRTDDEAEAIGILDHLLLKKKITPPWREKNPFLEPLDA